MSIREGLSAYYEAFGVRGVLAVSAYRLTGHPREITARPACVKHPVHIRVRTTDASIYREILLCGEYGNFNLPFTPTTISCGRDFARVMSSESDEMPSLDPTANGDA